MRVVVGEQVPGKWKGERAVIGAFSPHTAWRQRQSGRPCHKGEGCCGWHPPESAGRVARARAQRVEFSRPASTPLSHGRCNALSARTPYGRRIQRSSHTTRGKCTCVEHPSLVRDRRESRGHSSGSTDFSGVMSGAIASPGRLGPVGGRVVFRRPRSRGRVYLCPGTSRCR